MLENISISNFKRLKKANLPLRKINVLVGPNGAGKSSVIQLLTLLKQSVGQRPPQGGFLQYGGEYIELGSFKDVAYMHEASSMRVRLSFALRKHEVGQITRVLENLNQTELRLEEWIRLKRQKVSLMFEFSWGEEGLTHQAVFLNKLLLISSRRRGYKPKNLPSDLIIAGGLSVSSKRNLICGWSMGGPTSIINEIKGITEVLRSIVWSRFQRFHPLLVSRGLTRYQYELTRDMPREIESRRVEQVGSKAANTLMYMLGRAGAEKKLEQIAKWASEFGVRIRPNLLSEYKVSVEGLDPQLHVWSNIVLHGFGASQLLPIIIQGLTMGPQSVLLVEEPEIHLHPRHQAKLVELFLDITSMRGRQVLITTHSEHIILRLQRRVAEGKLDAADLRVYYFDNLEGDTKITRIDFDEYGALKTWVPGFFEERFEESLAQLRASLEKAKKAARK